MPQIQCPIDYVPLQQVTAANLNAHVNSAVILPGIITDQTNITANTVASGDSILLYDLSATALREATAGDLLGSNVPVTTSAITAGANSDIVITPNDGTIVTGQAYTSADGLTVTVTSTAHALTVGQVILITAAATGYNGTFRVATVLTNSFTYVMTTAATAGSGTLSYIKKGLVKNPANKSIAGNLYVDGSTAVAGGLTVAGKGSFNSTGAVKIPSGTTAERPSVPVVGDLRNNTTSGFQEFYNGTIWVSINPLVKSAVLTQVIPNNTTYTYPTLNAWTNLPLNTLTETDTFVLNAASFTGSGTSQSDISLPAGTYSIATSTSIQSGGGSGAIVSRVYNTTAATVLGTGFVSYCAGYSHGTSICYAVFKLTVTSTINIQYFIDVNGSSNTVIATTPEVLFPTMITKLA